MCPVAVAPDDPQSYYSVGRAAGAGDARRLPAQPVRQPVEPVGARAVDRPGAVAPDRGAHHPLRRRRRHRRHDHRRRPLPQGAEPARADRRRRPRRLGVLGRLGPALPGRGHRRGLLADDVRPVARRPGGRGQRRGQLPDGPPGHRRGGPAHRRVGRHRGGRRPRGRPASLGPDDLVVVLIPDSGRGYLSQVFDDDWMARLRVPARRAGRTVADVLESPQRRRAAARVRAARTTRSRGAVNLMRGHGVSQLPVAKGELPLAAAEVLGAVDELALMDLAFRDPARARPAGREGDGRRGCRPSASASRSSWPSSCSTRAPAVVVLAGGRPQRRAHPHRRARSSAEAVAASALATGRRGR